MLPFKETQWSEDVDVLDDVVTTDLYSLIVFNDDINTFEHVIQTLIEVCEHTPEQAEQCTILIHYKGKCVVKNGEWDKLASMRNAICGRGISAEVYN
jgi:ATP-dependent Clp protease adaptor protein ClpS